MAKNGLSAMDSDLAIGTFLELPLGKESKKKVLWDNCARLYNFS